MLIKSLLQCLLKVSIARIDAAVLTMCKDAFNMLQAGLAETDITVQAASKISSIHILSTVWHAGTSKSRAECYRC